MKYEKSCGAVVFFRSAEPEYLIIFNKKGNAPGHWGFPKGHVEDNETEEETAMREIFEETGLKPVILKDFRNVSTYSPKEGVTKDSVYFLAESSSKAVTPQQSELADYKWCSFEEAEKLLTFDANILKNAKEHIDSL